MWLFYGLIKFSLSLTPSIPLSVCLSLFVYVVTQYMFVVRVCRGELFVALPAMCRNRIASNVSIVCRIRPARGVYLYTQCVIVPRGVATGPTCSSRD